MKIIGIDPGTTTGLAVKELATLELLDVFSMKIHEAMDYIKATNDMEEIAIIVEDARQRQWFGELEQRVYRRLMLGQRVDRRQLKTFLGLKEGSGSIKRDSRIWEDFLTQLQIPFKMVAPTAHKTKWKAEYFKRVTGYKHRTNEHGRDAAMLIHGITSKNFKIHFPNE